MSQGTLGIKSVKSNFFYFNENFECFLEQDSCEISRWKLGKVKLTVMEEVPGCRDIA